MINFVKPMVYASIIKIMRYYFQLRHGQSIQNLKSYKVVAEFATNDKVICPTVAQFSKLLSGTLLNEIQDEYLRYWKYCRIRKEIIVEILKYFVLTKSFAIISRLQKVLSIRKLRP